VVALVTAPADDRLDVAADLLGRGVALVLCGEDAGGLATAIAALRPCAEKGGRVVAMVGDPADPDVQAAAREMARELFGTEPQAASTMSAARQVAAGSGTV